MSEVKGTIGILTGGGDVPGLNPAIRAVTFRALREGYQVMGIRRGWAGLVDLVRDRNADNSDCVQVLTEDTVNRAGRTGGTFLHTSRTRPSHLPKSAVPDHMRDNYGEDVNDVLLAFQWPVHSTGWPVRARLVMTEHPPTRSGHTPFGHSDNNVENASAHGSISRLQYSMRI